VSTPRAGSGRHDCCGPSLARFHPARTRVTTALLREHHRLRRHAAGVLSYDPKQNQIDVEMKAAGQMLGTAWLPDLSRRS